MTDTTDIASKVEQLEKRLRNVTASVLLLVGLLFVCALVLDIAVQRRIPGLCKVFDEILAGEPVPALTLIAIKGRAISFTIDLALLAAVVVLAARRKLPLLVPVGTAAAFLVLAKAAATSFAMVLPLLPLLHKLGG